MNKEEIKIICDIEDLYETCENMEQLFDYYLTLNIDYQKIKQENEQLKEINEQHKKLNGELRTELNNIKTMVNDLKNKCTELDISGLTVCDIILNELK